ncbi:hypothetical protein [Photorhabdus khanii]|uniref:hypothetical protein n=1 Tax=Photorhabdus khanii TaxID=1004150 RepID=UPI001F00BA27|nr:hypothetical protein [Photorhabdus khanii]
MNDILAGRREVLLEVWLALSAVRELVLRLVQLWPVVGTATGAVLGRFVAGATAGAVTGSAMDSVLFDRYVCRSCEHTFD